MKDKATNTYEERNTGVNKAEFLFEGYVTHAGFKFHRFGFDEKHDPVDNFYNFHPFIRNLPDYVITKGQKSAYVHVKGTNKIKLEDLMDYHMFEALFCKPRSPIYIAFCFEDKVHFKKLSEVKQMLKGVMVKSFDNDGKIYFPLRL